jgi:N-acetyltransferase
MSGNPLGIVLELTGLLRLEPLTLEHACGLFEAINDASVWAYIPWPRPRDADAMREYIKSAIAASSAGTERGYAMIDLVSGRVAGTSRMTDISPKHRQLEVGWTMIGPAFQRSHVNTSAKLLMLAFAFEAIDLGPSGIGCIRVQLKCDHRNVRSQEAMLRIGASYEGRLRKHRILDDGFVRDTMMYSITHDEWPGIKQRLRRRLGPES